MRTYEEQASELHPENVKQVPNGLLKKLLALRPTVFEEQFKALDPSELQFIDLAAVYARGLPYAEAVLRNAPLTEQEYAETACNLAASPMIDDRPAALRHFFTWHQAQQPAIVSNVSGLKQTLMDYAFEAHDQTLANFILEFAHEEPKESFNLDYLYTGSINAGMPDFSARVLASAQNPNDLGRSIDNDRGAAIAGHAKYFALTYPQSERSTPEAQSRLFESFVFALLKNNIAVLDEIYPSLNFEEGVTTNPTTSRAYYWENVGQVLEKNPSGEAVYWMMEHGWKPGDVDPVLMAAFIHDRPKIARDLIAAGASFPSVPDLQKKIWGNSHETVSLAHDHCDLRHYITRGLDAIVGRTSKQISAENLALLRELVEPKDPKFLEVKQKLFGNALESGKLEVAELLLEKGATISEGDRHYALSTGNIRVQKLIHERGRLFEPRAVAGRSIGPVFEMHISSGGNLGYQHIESIRFFASKGIPMTEAEVEALGTTAVGEERLEALLAASDMPGGERLLKHPKVGEKLSMARQNAGEWQARVHMDPPFGLMMESPYGFKPSTFTTVQAWIETEMARKDPVRSLKTTAAANKHAYQLSVLFGSPERVLQYLSQHGPVSETPLHDLAQFKLPHSAGWDVAAWGDAVLRYGPAMTRHLKFASELGGKPRASLSLTREATAAFTYPRGSENPSLAAICAELGVDEDDFTAALDAYKKIDVTKASSEIPDLSLPGEAFGKPGFAWKKVPAGDPRVLIAGNLVNCCQHIGGAGEDCAIHSAKSERGGCFFLSKPNKRGEEVVAVSWAWRGKNGELTLDSFEPISAEIAEVFPQIVESMAHKILAEYPEVTAFTIGAGGRTPDLNYPCRSGSKTAQPADYSGYRDSETQYIVFSGSADSEISKSQAHALEVLDPGAAPSRSLSM